MQETTIAAIATAPGAGGIAVVRLSGPESYAVAAKVFHPANPNKNVEEAMATTVKEFGRLLADGLEEGELARAKHLVKGANVRAMESTEHRLYRLCVNNLLNGSTESLEERLAKIDAVTEEDVMRVAKDILRADRLNVVVLGKAGRSVRNMHISDLGF